MAPLNTSVVICTHNRRHLLERTLDSCAKKSALGWVARVRQSRFCHPQTLLKRNSPSRHNMMWAGIRINASRVSSIGVRRRRVRH